MSQIKPFTSVTDQYVNNVFVITVEIKFVMPYQEFIVYFKLKRLPRLGIFTPVMNRIITEKTSNIFKRRS